MNKMRKNPPVCVTSLKLLGDYWTLRIIDELSEGELRFCELERRLLDANTATLTRRLKHLHENGLVVREQQSRADVTYALSHLGREALGMVHAVNAFSAAAQRESARVEH